MKKLMCIAALVLMLCALALPSLADTVKVGVLVSDATSSEALAFRSYYTEYIASAYDVEFLYSD